MPLKPGQFAGKKHPNYGKSRNLAPKVVRSIEVELTRSGGNITGTARKFAEEGATRENVRTIHYRMVGKTRPSRSKLVTQQKINAELARRRKR